MRTYFFTAFGLFLLICGSRAATHPLDGTWYNSYCSRVDLAVSEDGLIQGTYTSHTGSTGTSLVIGKVHPDTGIGATNGTPFALGVQWRLVNLEESRADGSWHWVSMFSGQYHPEQEIVVPDQDTYTIPETLEILNLLIATATLSSIANTAPLTWPQTLNFHKTPPSYCHSVEPGTPVAYKPTATDNISGNWRADSGESVVLKADVQSGQVTGVYTNGAGDTFNAIGLFDTLAPGSTSESVVEWQGLTLSLLETGSTSEAKLKALTGGVDYSNLTTLYLWTGDLQSTTWTDRFTEQTLDKVVFTKQ